MWSARLSNILPVKEPPASFLLNHTSCHTLLHLLSRLEDRPSVDLSSALDQLILIYRRHRRGGDTHPLVLNPPHGATLNAATVPAIGVKNALRPLHTLRSHPVALICQSDIEPGRTENRGHTLDNRNNCWSARWGSPTRPP